MPKRRIFRGIFWGLIALLLVAHVAGGWYYSSRIIEDGFTPDPEPIVGPNGDYELVEVTYPAESGDLDAWHLPADGSTWVIHVHGLNSSPAEPEALFKPIQDAGYPQLAIAYRNDDGQPTDPSGYHQYGSTEWEDLLGAFQFALANGAENVVVAGYSTGASLALSFAYRHTFEEIAGLILDSANIDLGSTVDYRASIEPLPIVPGNVPPTISWVAKFFTSLRIGVNWKTLDYIERAERSLRVPVLAFHGTGDDSIPIAESIALAEAQPDLVHLVQVEGAGHVESFEVDFDDYVASVLDFLRGIG
ncbi:MAG TPA: hypothetical protein VGB33_10460 [Acidimicrobiia bacterium]